MHLFDVREMQERERAAIEGSRLFDQQTADEIEKMEKGALLVFHCHTGTRSQSTAEHFRGRGFTNTHNLVGGIDAWSARIDSNVPRY